MAQKKTFEIKKIVMATGGGALTNVVLNILPDKIGLFQNKPALIPIAPALAASLGIYYLDKEYHPLFYGMLGATGAFTVDNLGIFNGLSRMNYEINGLEDLNRNPLLDWTDNMKSAASELEDRKSEMDEVAEMIELSSEE